MNAPQNDRDLPAGWWKRVRHDLRSTIAPMRMAVQLLRSGRVEPAEREEALQVLDRQLEHLLSAVDDVGELMHAQAGTLSHSAVVQDLNLVPDIVCGRGALVRELASRRLQLRCEPCVDELLVAHDPLRVSMLVEFLLMRLAANAAADAELVLSVLGKDDAALRLGGAGATLARDPELLYLQGIDAGGGEPALRAILMRQVLRAGGMTLEFEGEGALLLRFPREAA